MAKLAIHEEILEGEETPRFVLYCTNCGFSYSLRRDVSNFCTECGERIENAKPHGTTAVIVTVV